MAGMKRKILRSSGEDAVPLKGPLINKYLVLTAVVLFLFLASLLSLHVLRLKGMVRFYEPLIFTLHLKDSSAISEIRGITPTGRSITISRRNNIFHSSSAFLKGFVITADAKRLYPGDRLNFICGRQTIRADFSHIDHQWEKQSTENGMTLFLSPPDWKSQDHSLSFLLSVRHWTAGRNLLIAGGGLILLILILFLFKDTRPPKINRVYLFRALLILTAIAALILLCWLTDGFTRIHIASGLIFLWIVYAAIYFLTLAGLMKNRMLRQKIHLLITVIFFSFFALEIILRFSELRTYSETRTLFYQSPYEPQHSSWYYTRQPNTEYYLESPEFRYYRKSNALGLSNGIINPTRKPGEIRILALGDSFTEGDGAPADSTWLAFLKQDLSTNYPQHTITTMNAGVGGSDPYFEYVLLRDKLLRFEPDLVIVALGSDLEDLVVRGGMERFSAKGDLKYEEGPDWEWAYGSWFTMRLLVHSMGYNNLLMREDQYRWASIRSLAQLRYAFRLFELLSLKNNFEVMFAIYPLREEVIRNEYYYWDLVVQDPALDSLHIVSLLDAYIERGMTEENLDRFYWEEDGHHTASGYEAFSDVILEYFNDANLIEEMTSQDDVMNINKWQQTK